MKIAINALNALAGGGISSLINLLIFINKLDNRNEYFVIVSDKQKQLIKDIPPSFKIKVLKNVPQNAFVRAIWEQLFLPIYLLINQIDVLYSKANLTVIFAVCKIILTIENSNPYSELAINWDRRDLLRNKLLKILGWISAKRASRIIFVSQDSKNRIAKKLSLPDKKCCVIYHGFKPELFTNNLKNDINYRYILTVGAILPHKNLSALISAFNILICKYKYPGNLLIIGDIANQNYFDELNTIVSDAKLQKRVIFKGPVQFREITKYYKNAEVFALSSIEETFGMPLIEAMGMNIPIAASDCDLDENMKGKCFNPFKEVCGDCAVYFNPFDKDNMAEVINNLIINERLRNELVGRGKEKIKEYSLLNSIKKTIEIINSLEQ